MVSCFSNAVCVVAVVFVSSLVIEAIPTIYKRNDHHMLEPVLIPVSSTVIPLPVYKVGAVVGIQGDKPAGKPPTETKLVTVSIAKKKLFEKEKKDREAKIKPISKEEFVLSKDFL